MSTEPLTEYNNDWDYGDRKYIKRNIFLISGYPRNNFHISINHLSKKTEHLLQMCTNNNPHNNKKIINHQK